MVNKDFIYFMKKILSFFDEKYNCSIVKYYSLNYFKYI